MPLRGCRAALSERKVVVVGASLIGVAIEAKAKIRIPEQYRHLRVKDPSRFGHQLGSIVVEVNGSDERGLCLSQPPRALLA